MNTFSGNVPARIFVSYRREETAGYAGWLFERLAAHFGRDQIFKDDVDSIELGDDFVEVITTAVGSCDVLLALIGGRWLAIAGEEGRRRLDDPDDFVRLEIEAALKRHVRVIPILVDGARMPRADELPTSLSKLARLQALEFSPSRFDADIQRLLNALDRAVTAAHEHAREEAAGVAGRRRQVEQLQKGVRERSAVQDRYAVVETSDELAALELAAADPDALASTAREGITRREAQAGQFRTPPMPEAGDPETGARQTRNGGRSDTFTASRSRLNPGSRRAEAGHGEAPLLGPTPDGYTGLARKRHDRRRTFQVGAVLATLVMAAAITWAVSAGGSIPSAPGSYPSTREPTHAGRPTSSILEPAPSTTLPLPSPGFSRGFGS